jgi:hypothetical protein
MTISWTHDDETGAHVFEHEEWRVTAWPADDEDPAQVTVTHPSFSENWEGSVGAIEITSRGMRVRRRSPRTGVDIATIPFPVLAAIVEANAIISGDKK